MFNIMIVEDDKNTQILMDKFLTLSGYHTYLADNGIHALTILEKQQIDLVLLDLMMSGMDGFTFIRKIRLAQWNTPIIVTSAKESILDKKEAFLLGADDYMVKPVEEEELLLRIQALLRRFQIATEHIISINSTTLNYQSCSVMIKNEEVILPKKEFLLLYKLLSHPNTIFTKLQLMDEIWGLDNDSSDHTVNVHINRLRNKFENCPDFEIITVRGLGFKAVLHES